NSQVHFANALPKKDPVTPMNIQNLPRRIVVPLA
uniref:Uncharacterized protein n=1 Tax=Acrobeloides nanus TaxID=290746 RepID=A0A914D7B4_9BILA